MSTTTDDVTQSEIIQIVGRTGIDGEVIQDFKAERNRDNKYLQIRSG